MFSLIRLYSKLIAILCISRSLQASFQEAARLAFEAMLSATSGQRRQTHSELQDKVQLLLQTMKQVSFVLVSFSVQNLNNIISG